MNSIMETVIKRINSKPKKNILLIEDTIPQIYKPLFAQNFIQCVTGYHYINTEPINETCWETINTQIFCTYSLST